MCRARLIATATLRWCRAQSPVLRRGKIMPLSLVNRRRSLTFFQSMTRSFSAQYRQTFRRGCQRRQAPRHPWQSPAPTALPPASAHYEHPRLQGGPVTAGIGSEVAPRGKPGTQVPSDRRQQSVHGASGREGRKVKDAGRDDVNKLQPLAPICLLEPWVKITLSLPGWIKT